jgi:MFS family permease
LRAAARLVHDALVTWSGPLRSRNYRMLLASNVTSLAGSSVAYVTIPFAVLRIGGSASDVGYVAVARLIPSVAFLLIGGAIADRLPRHQVMVAANAVQALAQGAAAGVLLAGHATVWLLAVLGAVAGAGLGIYFPAAEGLLPQTVPEDQRAQAIAMDRTGQNAASIGGSAIGGILVGAVGPGWGLAVDAASFAIAGAMRAGMRFPAVPPARRASVVHDLRGGWREFVSRRWLWTMVLQLALVMTITAAALNVLGPLVADRSLDGARSWGFIVATYAAGAALGGVAMLKYRPRRMLVAATLCLPAWSLLLFALSVPLAVPADAAAALLAGAGSEAGVVLWVTARQQEIPAAMLSRIASYDIFGRFALAPIGTVVAGPLAILYGTSAVLIAGGIIVLALTGAVLFIPEVRHLRRRLPAPAE